MTSDKKAKARTYARNRTKLNRRGAEKFVENDGVFLLKMLGCVLAGSLWIKFSAPIILLNVPISGFPLGVIVGMLVVVKLEKRSENRKIFYAVLLICAITSYFLPSGIVI